MGKMIGFLVMVAVLSCAGAHHNAAPAPKPIPGTARYVLPQILPGQNPDNVLWALSMPVAAPLARLAPAPPPAPVPAPEGKRLHNLRLNDPHWATNQPIRAWEAAYSGAVAAAPAPAAVQDTQHLYSNSGFDMISVGRLR